MAWGVVKNEIPLRRMINKNSHAESARSASNHLVVGCGCTVWRLQELVEGVDDGVRVEGSRGVEETVRNGKRSKKKVEKKVVSSGREKAIL